MFVELVSKKSGFYENRFIQSASKVLVVCQVCSGKMWFPPSKAHKYKTCGGECTIAARNRRKQELKRNCIECNSIFFPRPGQIKIGAGNYCSIKCSVRKAIAAAHTEDANKKRADRIREMHKNGEIKVLRGEEHNSWKGGKEAYLRRIIESGKSAENIRRYRIKNPDKVDSFISRRNGRSIGRLPRGTVAKIGHLQRWFCAICHEDLEWSGYHKDHIVPLALGGLHEPLNIQLLCPHCNVKKSATHPIDYMQKIGRLL